jgi:hypothetical protein
MMQHPGTSYPTAAPGFVHVIWGRAVCVASLRWLHVYCLCRAWYPTLNTAKRCNSRTPGTGTPACTHPPVTHIYGVSVHTPSSRYHSRGGGCHCLLQTLNLSGNLGTAARHCSHWCGGTRSRSCRRYTQSDRRRGEWLQWASVRG